MYENQNNQNPHEQNAQAEHLTPLEMLNQRDQEIAAVMYERDTAIGDLNIAYDQVLPQVTMQEGNSLLREMNMQVYQTLELASPAVFSRVTNTANALSTTLSESDSFTARQLHSEVLNNGMRSSVAQELLEGIQDQRSVRAILDDAIVKRYIHAVKTFGPDSLQAQEMVGEASTHTLAGAMHCLADVTRLRRANQAAEEFGARNVRVRNEIDHGSSVGIQMAMNASMDFWIRRDARSEIREGGRRADHFSVQAILDSASSPNARDLIGALIGDPAARPRSVERPGDHNPNDVIASPLEVATMHIKEQRVEREERGDHRYRYSYQEDQTSEGRRERSRGRFKRLARAAGATVLVTALGVGATLGIMQGARAVSNHERAQQKQEQMATGKILDPIMVGFDKAMITAHEQDPGRFTLSSVGKNQVEITDTDMSDGNEETLAAMGTYTSGAHKGQPNPYKPLYATQQSAENSNTQDTDGGYRFLAPGGQAFAQQDGYDASGWQAQMYGGVSGSGEYASDYADTADPPAPLDAPTDINGNPITSQTGLAKYIASNWNNNNFQP